MPILGNLNFLPILNSETYMYILHTLLCAHIFCLISYSPPPLKMLEPAGLAPFQGIIQTLVGFPIFSKSNATPACLGEFQERSLHLQEWFDNTYFLRVRAHRGSQNYFLHICSGRSCSQLSQILPNTLGLLLSYAIYSSALVANLVSLDCIPFLNGSCC